MKNVKILNTVIKRVIFVLTIAISFVMQFIVLPRTAFFIPVYFLLSVAVALSMHEKEIPCLIYGLIIGALWDLASPMPDGGFAVVFTVFLLLAGLLTRYILRNTLLTAIIYTAAFSVVISFMNLLFFRKGINAELFGEILTKSFLPTAIINSLLTVPSYYFIRYLSVHFNSDKQQLRSQ